jgi:hypothetical protein
MRKQNILNHLLVSTAVLGTMLIYQLPTVQAETISEASPSSLEINPSIVSNTEVVKTTDETLSEQVLGAEKPVNQDLPPENQVTTATPSPLAAEVSSSSEIEENKTETPIADEAGSSLTEDTPPVTLEQTSTAETTITTTLKQKKFNIQMLGKILFLLPENKQAQIPLNGPLPLMLLTGDSLPTMWEPFTSSHQRMLILRVLWTTKRIRN